MRKLHKKQVIILAGTLAFLLMAGIALGGMQESSPSSASLAERETSAAGNASLGAPESVVADSAMSQYSFAEGGKEQPSSDTDNDPQLIVTADMLLVVTDLSQGRKQVRDVVYSFKGRVGSESIHNASLDQTNANSSACYADQPYLQDSVYPCPPPNKGAGQVTLTVQIPAADFEQAREEIESLGTVKTFSQTSQDVGAEVKDTQARVRAAQAGLKRVEALMKTAQSLSDVIALEQEITRRQSELDSLLTQQKYYAEATEMATLTVSLTEPKKKAEKNRKENKQGFLFGLQQGWDDLKQNSLQAATAFGRGLPSLTVLLIIAGLGGLVVRAIWVKTLKKPTSPSEEEPTDL